MDLYKLIRFLPKFSIFAMMVFILTFPMSFANGTSRAAHKGTQFEIFQNNTDIHNRIIISLNDNRLHWFHDNVIERFPVATGRVIRNKRRLTPLGDFRIMDKVKCKAYTRRVKNIKGCAPNNPYGSHFMSISARHNIGIHGTNQPKFVRARSNASKGCVRMLNEHVSRIYNNVSGGIPVKIVNSLKFH